MNFTESEISALLDAHDALVKAYVDSSLGFDEFVSAYGDFPRNYALAPESGTREEWAALRFFSKRIAFHYGWWGYCRGSVRLMIQQTSRTTMPAGSCQL